ncbi:universal stress protein [Terrimonas sp. NA20]|uniref:Universal stress protein n=1 Tax=Terrimonas ginsenosidimutans TaxID=2908004 RepID=A0ABS9KVD3_9BACT|nr:universal stress protein [Terrimonas ginsenosidimutans]MCG2616280.1 universal stress protein [Terrimonas ginsenosidimutans]
MKSIVAATNFSDASTNAVNYAADMAAFLDANLCIVYINPLPIMYNDVPLPGDAFASKVTDAAGELKELKKSISSRTNNRCVIHTQLLEGTVEYQLEQYCKKVKPFAVVMGSEISSAIERTLFGAKTITAMKHLHWPLVIVPKDAQFSPAKKIGFACDFRNVRDTIPVKEIIELVTTFKAELHIIHASPESGSSFNAETVSQAEHIRDLFAEINPKYHFIQTLNIEEPVLDFAEKNKFDLLIIVPKKHDLFTQLFAHSHSKRMAMQAHLPIIAVH